MSPHSDKRHVGIAGLAAVTVAAMVAGCTAMSPAECQFADWKVKGQFDGAEGRSQQYVERYVATCAKHGYPPNRALYEEGRQLGVKSFCTTDNGFRQGEKGKKYDAACLPHVALHQQFMVGYAPGRRVHAAVVEVEDAEQAKTANRFRIDHLNSRIAGEQSVMNSADSTEEQRETAHRKLKKFREEISRLQSKVYLLDRDRDEAFERCVLVLNEVRNQHFPVTASCY